MCVCVCVCVFTVLVITFDASIGIAIFLVIRKALVVLYTTVMRRIASKRCVVMRRKKRAWRVLIYTYTFRKVQPQLVNSSCGELGLIKCYKKGVSEGFKTI